MSRGSKDASSLKQLGTEGVLGTSTDSAVESEFDVGRAATIASVSVVPTFMGGGVVLVAVVRGVLLLVGLCVALVAVVGGVVVVVVKLLVVVSFVELELVEDVATLDVVVDIVGVLDFCVDVEVGASDIGAMVSLAPTVRLTGAMLSSVATGVLDDRP